MAAASTIIAGIAALAAVAGSAIAYTSYQEQQKAADENAKRVKRNTNALVEQRQADIRRYLASNEVSFFGSGIDVNSGSYDTVDYTYDAVEAAGARDIQNIKNTGRAQYENYLSQGRQAYLGGLGSIVSGVGTAANYAATAYSAYGGGTTAATQNTGNQGA